MHRATPGRNSKSPCPSGGLLSLYVHAARHKKCLRSALQPEKGSRGWSQALLEKLHTQENCTHTGVHKHTEGFRNGVPQHATRRRDELSTGL